MSMVAKARLVRRNSGALSDCQGKERRPVGYSSFRFSDPDGPDDSNDTNDSNNHDDGGGGDDDDHDDDGLLSHLSNEESKQAYVDDCFESLDMGYLDQAVDQIENTLPRRHTFFNGKMLHVVLDNICRFCFDANHSYEEDDLGLKDEDSLNAHRQAQSDKLAALVLA